MTENDVLNVAIWETKAVLRRDVLKLGAGAALLDLSGARHARANDPASATPFDVDTVREKARALSRSSYSAPAQSLPDQINNLNFDQFRSIEFRPERALWAADKLFFDVEFFPRGFLYRPRIHMNEVIDGQAHRVPYDADMFKYQDQQLRVTDDIGFSGLRLRCPLNTDGVMEECAVFLGASYFRAVAKNQTYGLSARGFANGTGDPKGEEFALFREFWLEKPKPGVKCVVVHALMDSPSVVGAFHFTIKPGDTTVFDVQTTFFPRHVIDKGGIAALTGMFYFDSNNRHHVDDWRPAAHDSEALQMWTGERQQLFRPLNNPIDLQFSAFHDINPQGFGLMQRRRAFHDFEDLALDYEKRPSLWIEPVGNWGEGAVDLVEIPTPNEVNDNIVSFWRPAEPMKTGQEYSYTYRMYWGWDTPWPTDAARIGATRVGEVTDHPDGRQFVIDFAGKPFENLPDNANFHLMWQTSAGTIKNVVAERNPHINGWRALFEFYPADAKIAELQCQLANDQGPVSEKWVYRWTP